MESVEADGVELGSNGVGVGGDDGGEMAMAMAEGKGATQAGSDVGIETGEVENDALDGDEEML